MTGVEPSPEDAQVTEVSNLGDRSRDHTPRERLADAWVHGFGIAAAIIGAVPLLVLAADQGGTPRVVATTTYVVGLLAMLSASAAYNLGYGTPYRGILRRIDRAAIFLLIAGTYTPFTTHFPTVWLAVTATAAVWTACVLGVVAKLVWPARFERLAIALYLGLGWGALLILGPLVPSLPAASIIALVAGGLLYTIGVLFHIREHLPFQNAIWHGFVICAAVCHYWSILTGVVLSPA